MKIAIFIALLSSLLVAPSGGASTIRGLGIGLDPTEAPTKSPTPGPTEIFVCDICEEGNVVTIPDGVVDAGPVGNFTCLDIVAASNAGLISEAQCLLVQPLAQGVCGCEPESMEPTEVPADPTDAPVDPTDAPVDPTDAPVDPTDAPVDPTDSPVDPTEAPTDAAVDPTEAPTGAPAAGACLTITETACSLPDFTTLCQLLGVFELEETLSDGTWTVFAPTNDAFAAVSDVVAGLDPAVILDVLLFHAVPDQVIMSSDFVCDGFITMANGQDSQTLCDEEAGSIFQVGEGNSPDAYPQVDPADIPVCNGVLHVVDNILIPGGVLPPDSPGIQSPDGPTSAPGTVVLVEVAIEFDGFAPETGWEITNSTGGTVMMVPIGSYPPLTETATEEVELLAGSNYTFTIFDLFGDGLSNPEDGSYSVSQGEGEDVIILVSGGSNFGRQESTNFTVF